jgi:hypothetical protein
MSSDQSLFTAFFLLPLIFFVISSCASTDEQRDVVGMRLLGEASEIETSLSGSQTKSQPPTKDLPSTTRSNGSLPTISTTSVVEILIPKPTKPSTTTLFIETPDKPFYVATAVGAIVEAFSKPTDPEARWILSNPGPFEGERVLLVRTIEEEWIQVSMPIRPHGTNAWVKRDSVSITEHKAKVIVDRYTGVLEGWKNGELLFKESFTGGSEEHPTPLGDFYINEINIDNKDASSQKLVGITAFSTTIDPTSEGDPAIAFLANESNEGSGELTTRGCIRVSVKVLNLLVALPLGTPVQIVG